MRTAARQSAAFLLSFGLCWMLFAGLPTGAPAQEPPRYLYDGSWPKLPLPNKWIFEGVTGLTVDRDDVVWVLHRPNDFDTDKTQNYASLDPPSAECCAKPPAVLAFNAQGDLVHSWDTAEGHLILADRQGFIWVGSDAMRKYSKEGTLVEEVVKHVPEQRAREIAARYGPAEPRLLARVEGGDLDEAAREIYVSDSFRNGRVMVFDMDTGEFKRGWGAYGKSLKDIPVPSEKYNPTAFAKDFLGHITMAIADGSLYVADRHADRIQVFTKQGKFQREFKIAPTTLDRGSTGGIAFSPDRRYLFVSDIMNNVVWIVNPGKGSVVGRFGFLGHAGGGFQWLHMVALDSKGNVYTGEVDTGKRVQRFVPSVGQVTATR